MNGDTKPKGTGKVVDEEITLTMKVVDAGATESTGEDCPPTPWVSRDDVKGWVKSLVEGIQRTLDAAREFQMEAHGAYVPQVRVLALIGEHPCAGHREKPTWDAPEAPGEGCGILRLLPILYTGDVRRTCDLDCESCQEFVEDVVRTLPEDVAAEAVSLKENLDAAREALTLAGVPEVEGTRWRGVAERIELLAQR